MARMRCGDCGTENRDAANFCGECGGRLERVCMACAAPLPDGLKFCDQCGTPVAKGPSEPAPEMPVAARKLVTVAFVDLGGSTAFGEMVDAETARTVMGRYHSLVTETVETHGGTVAKYIGDGVMVFFGVPEVAEDDAVRAVAFGADVQERFAPFAQRVLDRHGTTVTLRVGINTGEIVIGEDDVDVYGDALNVAARLEKACPHGGVLVGEETWRLARGTFAFEAQGEIEVHGRVGGVRPFLLALDEVVEDQAAPFVGRADELERLGRLFAASVAARRPALASVVGPAGVGKTRLSRELQTLVEADDALVFATACDREGDATLGPIADLLRPDEIADVDTVRAGLVERLAGEVDADRIVEGLLAVLGLAVKKVSVEETFWALRRLIERLGRDAPVVVVVDDIQWASEQLLDLFEHLATWVDDTPLLLVLLARPEIRELRPELAQAGRSVDELVLLAGLDPESTAALAARLLGTDELPRGLAERLPASTDGNPLFVRELVRMLVDERVIRLEGDRWVLTVEPDAIDVPPTIQSLLAARVERLPADERAVLERAAVIGPDFTRDGLAQLCHGTERSALPQLLRSLARKDLIEATGSYWGDDPIHRFHHVLIRDAVYRRLLKEARAGLHERIGAWMVEASADVLGEHDAAIGHHFEQAFRYRRELGDDDGEVLAIGALAAGRLAAAARVALRDDDLVAAGALAQRALACLADDAPARPETLILACEALLEVGDAVAARPFVDELGALAERAPALAGWAQAYDAQAITIAEPDRLADAESIAARAVAAMADIDDPAGRAKAHLVRAAILARRGRIGECEAELDVALTEARAAHDTRRVVSVLGVAPLAALWGPSPVARAGGRCLDVLRLLRITASSPAVEAVALRCQAVLEALRGRFDTAYSLIERARIGIEELGLRRELAEIAAARGQIHLLADDAPAAETALREAHSELVALGAGAEASQAAALLARALLRLDRLDEVERLVDEAEGLAGQNLKSTILGATVRAEWLLALDRIDEARTVAERAVEVARRTDLILDHAGACDALDAARGVPSATAGRLREQKGVSTSPSSVTEATSGAAPVRAVPDPARGRPDRTPFAERVASWNDALQAAWNAGDRDAFLAAFAPELVVEVFRTGPRAEPSVGSAALDNISSLHEAFPLIETAIVDVDDLGVATARCLFRDGTGNELVMRFVLEFDDDGRNERQTSFDDDDVAGVAALFAQRVRARADGPPGDGFVGRLTAVVDEMDAAWMRGDWETFRAFFAQDTVIVAARALAGETLRGTAAVEQTWSLQSVLPSSDGELEAASEVGIGLSRNRFHDDAGNELVVWLVGELDEDGLIERMTAFDEDDLVGARALFEQRVRERGGEPSATPPSPADPPDRIEFVVPGLRRLVEGTPYGQLLRNRLRAWDGDDDIRWVEAEILAVRGHRHGVARVTFSDEAGVESTGLAVDEADREGRIVRSVHLDADAVIEAIELAEEWFAAAPDAIAVDMALAGSSLLHSVHDPSRRDEMLARLDPDLVMPNVSGATLLGDLGRDEFVALQDTVTEAAERADFWWVWGESRSETLTCSIVRRDAVLPDGSTAEWLNATVSQWRDGRMVLSENYAIEDLARARARAAELNGVGAFGVCPEALAGVSFVDFVDWNDAARSRLRHTADVNAGRVDDPALAAAGGDLPEDPYRLIEVLAVEGHHRCLTHEAVLGVVDRLVVFEMDDDGRTLVVRHYDPDRLDEALADVRSPRIDRWEALPIRPRVAATTHPGGTPIVSVPWFGDTVSLRSSNTIMQDIHDHRVAGVRDARVVGPLSDRFSPDVVRTDHRLISSGTMGADEMDRSTQVLADLGLVLAAGAGLAYRGQHHSLAMASMQSAENEILTIIGNSFRADGLMVHFDVNDAAVALSGYHRMLDRYLADDADDAEPGWVAIDRAFVDALAADDPVALRAVFDDDLQATLADGTVLDANGYVGAHLDVRRAVPGALSWIAGILVAGDRAMVEIRTADLDAGIHGDEWFQYVIWGRRDGRIVSAEHHRDAVIALDRLSSQAGPEVPVTFTDPALVDVVRDLPWWPSVLRIREEWQTSPESLIEWLYGREDIRSESMIPVVGSGVKQGAEVVELSKGLQVFFPRVVVNEVAAVLGSDLMRALIVLADADGANQFAAQFVIQFGEDGRIVRQATFDSDDEAQAQATLEAWHRERPLDVARP